MAEREVKVKIGADTSGLENGLSSAQSKLSTFAKVGIAGAVAAVGTLAAGLVSLTKESLAQIDVTTKLARSLGLTQSAFAAMTLVAGEAGVEQGKLASMIGLMQRNIDGLKDGTQAQVNAFGRLGLSITDLQGLSADQQFSLLAERLNGIVDPTDRTALAMDTLGRAGRDAINMIGGYSEKLDAARLFQERFGVAVSQTAAEDVETANDAVGRLSMVMEGLGNRMATAVAPAITATANALVSFAASVIGIRVELDQFFGTLENAKAMLGEELFAKLFDSPDKIREYATSLDEIVVEMDSLKTIAATAVPQLQILADELDDLGEEKAATAMRNFAEEIVQAKADLEGQIITLEEFNAKIADIAIRSKEVVDEFEKINGADFSTAFGNIAKLATGLWEAATAAKAARAAMNAAFFEQSDAGQRMARYGGRATTSDQPIVMQNPSALAPTSSPRSKERPFELGVPDQTTNGGGGGAGAGIKDMFAQRLEALQEGLQTEAETVQAWYDEGLTTLQTALERKMVTEEEYRALRERLEQEHNERLGRIREIGNESAVSMALGAGEEILSAIGQTNQKALRIAKVFGAAQALISAYQGAAEALKLPFPKNIAAAAAVLAKGIGFVSAIKSVNAGGGSAGGGGGSSAAVAATGGGTTETRTANINFYGGFQPTQETIGMIASGLNDWLGDGGRLNMRTA